MRNLFRTFNYLLCPPAPPPTTSITADDFATFFTDKTKTISSQFSPSLTQDLQPTRSTAQTPASTSWTGACEGRAGPRLVVTHRLSWVRWSRGCRTLTSSRLEGPALSRPSPVGPRLLHARQGHPCSTLRWTECPWTWEDAGRTESRSWVWWSSGASEMAWGALARAQGPYKRDQGSYWRTRGGARLERQCVSKWGLSVWCDAHLAPQLGRGRGRRHRVLGPDPAAHWRRERGMGVWRRGLVTRGSVAEQNKKETKDSPPGPPPGEGVVRSPSPEEQDPKAPGRPSQGRRLPWRFTGLTGAEAGCAGLLRPAPRCGRSAGCCCGRAGAEVEAAGGRPRRRADGGAAAGGGVETAADRRGRMWRNASVCFCAAENCWAKSSE